MLCSSGMLATYCLSLTPRLLHIFVTLLVRDFLEDAIHAVSSNADLWICS
jgi:hypothetical protein